MHTRDGIRGRFKLEVANLCKWRSTYVSLSRKNVKKKEGADINE